MRKRIAIAEDHTILRAGLRAMLSSNTAFEVVGEADNGRDAVRLVGEVKPDLVLMDLSMPGLSGMDAIRDIKQRNPATRILVLTVHKAEEYIHASLEAGADGYLLKDAAEAELMLAVERVLGGKVFLSPEITEKVVNGYLDISRSSQPKTTWDSLSYRERQVLKLVAEGFTNKRIADYLCISVKTVEKHRASLMKKLDVHGASGLVTYAITRGLTSQ
jgi:DNA-binding NarL/FixJ family response regulator